LFKHLFAIFGLQLMTANGRPVVDFDHIARNGVVHVISEVPRIALILKSNWIKFD